jgi:outer membrane protein assembly factor BamB
MFKTVARVLTVCVAVLTLGGCIPWGEQNVPVELSVRRPDYEIQLREFIAAQRLTSLAPLRLYPADAKWAFLDEVLSDASRKSRAAYVGFPLFGDIAISEGIELPEYRRCLVIGPFSVWRPKSEACPGEWTQNRGDRRSTAVSWFRLNWLSQPQHVEARSLELAQVLSSTRVLTARDPLLGDVALVQNGSGVEAFTSDGRRQWKNNLLGLGEILDVVDLDGDGELEAVYSARATISPGNPSTTAPGTLYVLSLASGESLWRYQFTGLEFGPNRYRTTIASVDGATTKSIFAVMTYSSSMMRFDFERGVRNGRLAWRSEPLQYDSPDKAPLIVDLDSDGRSEVVIDSLGIIYAIDASTGVVKGSIQYANAPTFGGFLKWQDFDDDGRPEIISFSSSIYFKGYAVVSWRDGQFVLRHSHVWEQGLQNGEVAVSSLGALVPTRLANSAGLLVSVSAGQLQDELQFIEPLTGVVAWRLPGHKAVYTVSSGSEGTFIATKIDQAAAIVRVSDVGAEVLTQIPGARWIGPQANGYIRPSSRREASAQYPGALLQENGAVSLALVDSAGRPTLHRVDGVTDSATLSAHAVDPQTLLFSDGKSAYRVSPGGSAARWFVHSPRTFATPLVADLDGQGKREIIAPFREGLSRFNLVQGKISSSREVFATSPLQERESFRMPLLIDDGATLKRAVVGFETAVGTDGVRRPHISARSADDLLRWRTPLNASNWEQSIAAIKGSKGEMNVALRDSRSTTLLNGVTGAAIWSADVLGECQRQMASADWNGDGVADVAVQAGAVSWIHDGATGSVLWTQSLTGSYGAYSAFATAADSSMTLVHHNAGGLSIVDRRGLVKDAQIDERRVESIPVVIGRRSLAEPESTFQITGAGQLRVFDTVGSLVAGTHLSVPVVTMTGAYVDSDDAIDLLIGTFDGELIAVSGSTLQVLWRVQLGAAVGTAVATDLDGDGHGEIVVITSDAVLHVIRP